MNGERVSFAVNCAAAVVLIIAAYANSLDNSFHFDDAHVIETNVYLRSLEHVPKYFTDAHTFSSLPQNATYRPLVTLSLAIDHAIGNGAPRPFHITQIVLLLILGTMLVVFFTPIVGRWAALFAATLFCVHTANTETMNLISARSELLSTIGLLGAFLLYQRSAFARRTFLYLVPLAIGALAKAPLVVFAPLLFLYALFIERQPWRRAARIALPSLVVGLALLLFLNSMNAPEWKSGAGSMWQYVITQPFVWLHYARLFLLPIGLTADTDWQPFTHWYDTRATAGYAFVLLLLYAIRRAPPAVAFGLAWFAIALLPTSIFPLAEVANEHRLFFAFIGLVLAAAHFIQQRRLMAFGVAVLVLHGIATHERNEVWRSEESLWADVVEKSPGNGRAWMNHGLAHMAVGRHDAARAAFDRAAALAPNYWLVEVNRGVVEGQLGNHVAAERHFLRALEMNADHNAHFLYGRWLARRGRETEALIHLAEARRFSPGFADAITLEQKLLATKPQTGWPTYDAAFQAGLVAIGRKEWGTAVNANRAALGHDPKSSDAHNNLGWALEQLGFRDQAAREYESALVLNPNHHRARNNLRVLRPTPAPAPAGGRN